MEPSLSWEEGVRRLGLEISCSLFDVYFCWVVPPPITLDAQGLKWQAPWISDDEGINPDDVSNWDETIGSRRLLLERGIIESSLGKEDKGGGAPSSMTSSGFGDLIQNFMEIVY